MVKGKYGRLIIVMGFVACLFLQFGNAQSGKKEFTFRGKVAKVDSTAKTLTVNGENVAGWMSAMTMIYAVDKDDVFKTIKVGDQITAKVYEGDFKTLHAVEIVPPKSGSAPAGK